MNLRLNIILIIIVTILATWYFSLQQDSENLANLIKKEGQPEYVGDKIETSVYDKNGNAQYFAQADEVKNYEETGKIELVNPLLNLFSEINRLKEWQITASNAEIDKNKMLHLVGNVKIDSLNTTSKLQHIETEELFVDLKNQDVLSNKEVSVLGVGFRTKGTGLNGNLKQQQAILKADVKTHLEPMKIKQIK